MKTLNELQTQYYETFKGLPSNSPIVRNNQPNDAFELVVLKVLFGKELPSFTKDNASKMGEYIIAPPDSGIDIFFQHENGDDSSFDVIQVKNYELTESDIRDRIIVMERTIEDYCKKPNSVNSESCREILSNSNLDKTNKNRCTYYVVHTGTIDDFSGSNENEKVITKKALDILYRNESEFVEKDELQIGQYMEFGKPSDDNGAIVCSLNGYDLAELCNTYYNTEVGRNILFGSNLRESLMTKKSKPFQSMSNTINTCPENFWYYNNGITIIARDIIQHNSKGILELRDFSIVNGAQTTSALGLFLRDAKKNNDQERIEKLKSTSVLTRILKVPDETIRQDIAIFNNTQNPITSRDMVANRPEQKRLHEWLLDDSYPQIYVEVRRGAQVPASFNRGYSHRITTNEELAQLVYASFLQKPFTAKDKKSALFNNDYTQSEYVINKIYHDVFNWDETDQSNNGVIFTKSKEEIDELLFVQQLYKEAKRFRKSKIAERLKTAIDARDNARNEEEMRQANARIDTYNLNNDTVGICMFYFITFYYELKAQYGSKKTVYNYDKYYSDKQFRTDMIKDAVNLFLNKTISIIVDTAKENGKSANVNNWVRSAACEGAFLDALRGIVAEDYDLEESYKDFCKKYSFN